MWGRNYNLKYCNPSCYNSVHIVYAHLNTLDPGWDVIIYYYLA